MVVDTLDTTFTALSDPTRRAMIERLSRGPASDARMLWRGGIFGTQRLARHLWRTCFALFIATASIFLARPQLFPALLTKTHVLFLLGILPLLLMVFWLVRVLFTKAFKTA